MPISKAHIIAHQQTLSTCRKCPEMIGPVIIGSPATGKIMQIGQAPGVHEGRVGKPFGWTAGKTLFKWYESIGIDEGRFRNHVYMAAVCRCFPGKNPRGGDRIPSVYEIQQCRSWLHTEFELLRPRLVIPVGKLAVQQLIQFKKLTEVIGQSFKITVNGITTDCIPLPHPSGLSTWHRMQPGKTLLEDALHLIQSHPQIKPLVQ